MEKGNRFLEECEGVRQNGDENRRRTWTKWCVSERWNINIVDIKILNEPKVAHFKTEQHGTFDSCCTSSIVHKNLKGSVVALEGTARNCKIKSCAWLQKKVRPPNCVSFCKESRSHLRKNAASKLENVTFLQWSCSLQIVKIPSCQNKKTNEGNPTWLH
jgi:hypothetical protein